MNVVSRHDFLASGIHQKPLFASSLLETAVPDNCAKVSSTFGSGCTSRRTLSFNGSRSTQILIAPSFLGTTTIPAHHGVGTSTWSLPTVPESSVAVERVHRALLWELRVVVFLFFCVSSKVAVTSAPVSSFNFSECSFNWTVADHVGVC